MKKKNPRGEPKTLKEAFEALPADVTKATTEQIQSALTTNQILENKDKPKEKKPLPPRSPVVETLLTRFDFEDKDMAEFGRLVVRQNRMIEAHEAELASIKTNYKAKIQAAEAERDRISQIIGDGFEMREVKAYALVWINKKERQAWKVYYRADDGTYMRKESIAWTSGVTFDMFTMLPEGHKIENPLPKEARGNFV